MRAIARERVEGEDARARADSSDSSASSVWGRIGESKGWEGGDGRGRGVNVANDQ